MKLDLLFLAWNFEKHCVGSYYSFYIIFIHVKNIQKRRSSSFAGGLKKVFEYLLRPFAVPYVAIQQ